MRSSRSIEILCLALASLVLVWSHALSASRWPALALLFGYGSSIVVFGARALLPGRMRLKLQIESWTMLVFITAVLCLTGKSSSPLFNLYLLPLIFSALTLGRAQTLAQVAAVAVCHVALAATTPGVEVASLLYASRAIGQCAPILLVAYLTTTLSADITEAREHIETLAQTDPLTGLLNERAFSELLQREHAACEKARSVYSLLYIDLDRLKEINEGFGHEGGNSALKLVAQCLQRSIRNSDTAARLGGGEFALLLPSAGLDIAEVVVNRVRHNVYKSTLDLRSRMIRCSVSIGVVSYPKDGRDVRELLNVADRKMYRDKELRRAPGATSHT